ncbi:hypothetical protein SEA_SAMPSON_12 [Gordonia Phage Sampson]|uniref:Uncharacterized protein n=2 Tax=Zitchvirus TaxID=2948963 RepID=A0A976YGW9_9CAUD|nr:hypothetical protein SEA_SAMPSON_12 [Gordonia Phage Sampson]UVG34975.1 hypothetical protein SEA_VIACONLECTUS_12 [Gordonia phage ViaConlectus]
MTADDQGFAQILMLLDQATTGVHAIKHPPATTILKTTLRDAVLLILEQTATEIRRLDLTD